MENDFFFPPYIGDKYADADNFFNGKKVLIIGNSHYCDKNFDEEKHCGFDCKNFLIEEKCPTRNRFLSCEKTSWTKEAIDEVKKEGSTKAGDKLTSYVRLGGIWRINDNNKKEFWDSIIFYNFLQRAVPDPIVDNNKFEKELFISETEIIRFFRWLEEEGKLPDVILIAGERQVFNLLPLKNQMTLVQSLPREIRFYNKYHTLHIYNKTIKVITLFHPSAPNKSYEEQREIIKGFAPELFRDCQ